MLQFLRSGPATVVLLVIAGLGVLAGGLTTYADPHTLSHGQYFAQVIPKIGLSVAALGGARAGHLGLKSIAGALMKRGTIEGLEPALATVITKFRAGDIAGAVGAIDAAIPASLLPQPGENDAVRALKSDPSAVEALMDANTDQIIPPSDAEPAPSDPPPQAGPTAATRAGDIAGAASTTAVVDPDPDTLKAAQAIVAQHQQYLDAAGLTAS